MVPYSLLLFLYSQHTHAHTHTHSLPADFFDPGVTERVDEDADRNSGGRSGETVKSETNSQASADGKDSKTEEDNGANSSRWVLERMRCWRECDNIILFFLGSEKSQESGGAIPEGFFDDPKMDAKVIFFTTISVLSLSLSLSLVTRLGR